VISPSLIGFGRPHRNDPNSLPSQGVGDEQQAILDHTDRHKAILAFVLAVVSLVDSAEVFEHLACHLKTGVMFAPVTDGFNVVPLEIVVLHNTAYQ
jgi:hypothetical protein